METLKVGDLMKKCKNCGTLLSDEYAYCPECGMPIEKEKEKSYWFDKKIWAVFIALAIITLPMQMYLNSLTQASNSSQAANKTSELTPSGQNGAYSQATNINYLGISYIKDDSIYITMNQQVIKYNSDYSSQEVFLDGYKTTLSEDENYYYYVDENNDYIRRDKTTQAEDSLLMNVYYVHNLGDVIYYQNDSDNESIHCLDLTTNEDTKINDEVSYCLIVDQEKECIFYVDYDNQLKSIKLDGSEEKVIGEGTSVYTYDGEYLYYITSQGLMKSDVDGNAEMIYDSTTLGLVNMIGDKLIIQDNDTIYQMDRDGKNLTEIYNSLTSMTFEVVGDKLLVLSTGSDLGNGITYQIVELDGTSKSLTDNQTGIAGNEI